jgi:(2Fe-2S) ferredoxin
MIAISNHRCVRICQNRTCRKQGSADVLAAFTQLSIPGVEIIASGCLGQCGNGPMVLVLPNAVWYSGVLPRDVPMIVEQCLLLEGKD